ncbi:hypothetical protein [Nocardia uniformis]|uniref:hypothetical protein n=1 Tax=Nocardia uniformis TaxID=53432 RepID=UPI001BB2309F|nr:hypothetical protein [Nocardia uniformis]
MNETSVDELILAEKILPALQSIQDELGCSLSEAIAEFSLRYNRLRIDRPDDFTLPHGEYGRNVYT